LQIIADYTHDKSGSSWLTVEVPDDIGQSRSAVKANIEVTRLGQLFPSLAPV
jgi:hypothetical protein